MVELELGCIYPQYSGNCSPISVCISCETVNTWTIRPSTWARATRLWVEPVYVGWLSLWWVVNRFGVKGNQFKEGDHLVDVASRALCVPLTCLIGWRRFFWQCRQVVCFQAASPRFLSSNIARCFIRLVGYDLGYDGSVVNG